jgi:protein ImuB
MPSSKRQEPRRRFLALWFPYLSCERLRRGSDLAPGAALALVERTGNALRLAAVDAQAWALGLSPGLPLADARARCPALATLPADAQGDAREIERLARALQRFTPTVTLDPPDGLVLDISGCAHLSGSEDELARQAMEAAGYTARHALADNPVAARALARHGGGEVAALPLAALDLDDEALAALRRAGLNRIGDLAARPLSALAARFGEATVRQLRQLLGETSSPLVPQGHTAPIRFTARFAEPLVRTEYALEAIASLLGEAARTLVARGLGGRRFIVVLHRSDNARRRLTVETSQPTRDPAIVLRLLDERIEALADPLDPGFGFDAIELRVARTEPLAARQIVLGDETARENDSLDALLDRLGVRLGPDRVRRLFPRDRHLPERAQTLAPALHSPASPWPAASDQPPRPLLLLDPPQGVEVIAGVPDGPPQRFRWRGRLHRVMLAEGPERIGAEWWRRREGHLPGKAGLTRDYYRIEDDAGRRFWIFRHGLFGEQPDPRWYLHGLFA